MRFGGGRGWCSLKGSIKNAHIGRFYSVLRKFIIDIAEDTVTLGAELDGVVFSGGKTILRSLTGDSFATTGNSVIACPPLLFIFNSPNRLISTSLYM